MGEYDDKNDVCSHQQKLVANPFMDELLVPMESRCNKHCSKDDKGVEHCDYVCHDREGDKDSEIERENKTQEKNDKDAKKKEKQGNDCKGDKCPT